MGFDVNCNNILYKGYYYDRETKLYYLKSRFYNPQDSIFLTDDDIDYLDITSITGLDLRCYCNNNPMMYSDPDGHMPLIITAMLIGYICGTVIGGGYASVIGGLISGSVDSLETIAIAFFIGGIANVVGRGISDMLKNIRINKMNGKLLDKATEIASLSSKNKSLTIWNLIGVENTARNEFKSWGTEQILNLLSTEVSYKLSISIVNNALRYYICSSLVSCTTLGWY